MGIEWFRDLSITLLCVVTIVVLIFAAVLAYRMYRTAKSTLQVIRATSQGAYDTVMLIQECIKPIFPILSLIQGISGGIQGFMSMCKKEKKEKGETNE